MISFLAAIGLETLLPSDELWTRLPIGTVLGVVVLLISWCVWTMSAGRIYFSPSYGIHVLKDHLVGFARGLRVSPRRPRPDAGVVGGGGGQV